MNLFLLNLIIIIAVGISIFGDILAKTWSLGKATYLFPVIALALYTISSVIWLYLLKHIRLSIAVTWWQSVAIILAVFVGIFYFKERVNIIEVVAMVMIISGMVLLNFQH